MAGPVQNICHGLTDVCISQWHDITMYTLPKITWVMQVMLRLPSPTSVYFLFHCNVLYTYLIVQSWGAIKVQLSANDPPWDISGGGGEEGT